MAELESNLKCPICLELYKDPVALPCMHSFCRDCLMEHFSSKSRSTFDTKVQIPCPNCKKLYPLSKLIIRGMQRNFQLQSIVESYQKQHQKAWPPPCDMCKENPADKRCRKCEVSYCPGCLKMYHPPNRPPFSTHDLAAIGGGSASGGGKHGTAGGGGGGSSGTAEAIKAQFRQDVEDMSNGVQKANKYITELNDSKLQVKKKAKALENGITIEGRKLREHISRKEKEHTESITEESKQKLSEIDVHMKEYQEYSRKQDDLMAAVKALLKEPDENAFLKTASSMRTKVQSSKQSKPRQYTNGTNLVQSAELFQAFKTQCKGLMQDEKQSAPSTPGISRELCICHDTSIAICIPSLNTNVSEAAKIDMIKYKYKKPVETDWTEGRAHADQIESDSCINIDSLSPSASYSISIRAHNPFGWSPWSKVVLAQTSGSQQAPKEEPPLKPSIAAPKINTSATKAESEKVTLKWLEGEESDAHVVAYSPADGSERWTYQVAQNCGNSYTISGLTAGMSYLFKVGGCGRNGFTSWSKKVKIGPLQKAMPARHDLFGLLQGNHLPMNDSDFTLDEITAHPCLLIDHMTINHPMNACPSISDGFTGNSYSVFGNTIFTSGVHYWQVAIHGMGSKIRFGIAKPDVSKDKLLGTGNDAWVLVMDARSPFLRQGSHVLHGNQMHKSGGEWIPFSRHIGVTLDYVRDRVAFAVFDGPPSPTTKRTNHTFEFVPPPRLRPVFAIDEKSEMSLEVTSGTSPPMPRCGPQDSRSKEMQDLNREMLQQCAQQ